MGAVEDQRGRRLRERPAAVVEAGDERRAGQPEDQEPLPPIGDPGVGADADLGREAVTGDGGGETVAVEPAVGLHVQRDRRDIDQGNRVRGDRCRGVGSGGAGREGAESHDGGQEQPTQRPSSWPPADPPAMQKEEDATSRAGCAYEDLLRIGALVSGERDEPPHPEGAPMPPTVIVAAATVGTLVGTLMWNAVASVVILIAVIRVVTVAAEAWPRHRWSKAGWIVAALWVSLHVGGLVLPVGAIVALVQARTYARQDQIPPPIPDLPLAASTPWNDPTGTDTTRPAEGQDWTLPEEQA